MNTNYKQTVATTADTLITARKEWEQGTMKASNDELYALLARCFDFYLAVSRSYDLPKALNQLLTERGFTYTNSTSLPLKVVRLVFADPSDQERYKHRLLTYARVLTIAKEQKQTAEQLPAFIEQNGGIDEIRRQGATGETKADKEKKDKKQEKPEKKQQVPEKEVEQKEEKKDYKKKEQVEEEKVEEEEKVQKKEKKQELKKDRLLMFLDLSLSIMKDKE